MDPSFHQLFKNVHLSCGEAGTANAFECISCPQVSMELSASSMFFRCNDKYSSSQCERDQKAAWGPIIIHTMQRHLMAFEILTPRTRWAMRSSRALIINHAFREKLCDSSMFIFHSTIHTLRAWKSRSVWNEVLTSMLLNRDEKPLASFTAQNWGIPYNSQLTKVPTLFQNSETNSLNLELSHVARDKLPAMHKDIVLSGKLTFWKKSFLHPRGIKLL